MGDTAEESSGGGAVAVSLVAAGLLIATLYVGLQARGYNVAGFLQTAGASAREFASTLPLVQDYSTAMPEAGNTQLDTPIVQEASRDTFNPDRHRRHDSFNPDG